MSTNEHFDIFIVARGGIALYQPADPEGAADINEIHVGAMKTGSFLTHLLCDVCRGFGAQNPELL
jgi:hypothetical protein